MFLAALWPPAGKERSLCSHLCGVSLCFVSVGSGVVLIGIDS